MHLSEFKAWFEGFTENMEGPPNKKQWARIQKRVGEITESYTPTPIFIDRYIQPYYPHWGTSTTYSTGTTSGNTILLSDNIGRDDWVSAGNAEYSHTLNG